MLSNYFLRLSAVVTGVVLLTSFWIAPVQSSASSISTRIHSGAHAYTVRNLASKEQVNFCEGYKDEIVLINNRTSRCGYTYQYENLEKLYSEFRYRGFIERLL